MKEIKGLELRKEILIKQFEKINGLINDGIHPCIAVMIVGNDPSSKVYVNSVEKLAKKQKIKFKRVELPETSSEKEVEKNLMNLNEDHEVHGILLQMPLPTHLNSKQITSIISKDKDLDCIHPFNQGLLMGEQERFIPCTPYSVLKLIEHNKIETSGKNIVIVGRSHTVGRPLSVLLSNKKYNGMVTLCHSRTQDLKSICQKADILIAAIGKAEFIRGDFIKKDAVVIDVGINSIDDPESKKGYRLVGDVAFDEAKEICSMITPVPGGVGPMTIAMLFENLLGSWCQVTFSVNTA